MSGEPTDSSAQSSTSTKPKVAWITSLKAEAFRGIPKEIELDVSSSTECACALIVGDNGSGKSSLIDAIQFALQGEIQGVKGAKAVELAECHTVDALSMVGVTLSDGGKYVNQVSHHPDTGVLVAAGGSRKGFGRTPLVVRRSDILRFWETPAAQRQTIFMKYFHVGPGQSLETPQELNVRLEAERLEAKTQLNAALRAVAEQSGFPVGKLPKTVGDFNRWVDGFFHGGRDRKTHRLKNRKKLDGKTESSIQRARTAMKEMEKVKSQQKAAAKLETKLEKPRELAAVLEEASESVTAAFRAISPRAGVESFEMKIGVQSAVALDLEMRMESGLRADPKAVLSEANRDLIAFLIFVAIAKAAAARGQAKILILDDVFQSIDAPIRVAALDFVVGDLPDWQLFVTAHDRLWREQVLGIFSRRSRPLSHFEIAAWSPLGGPDIRRPRGAVSRSLNAALDSGDPSLIAAQAGRLLEQTCDVMSWTFPVSVNRRADDRYTLGDLWPPVAKVMKKTPAKNAAEEVDLFVHLRNMLGAHPNDWAESASLDETTRFGRAVLGLVDHVRCSKCDRWIERSPERNTWVCRCGATRLARA